MATGHLLSFGPYLLDTQARRLTRDGADVRLAARQLDLLCLLASSPGQVLDKETLIARAWNGLAVTSGSLDNAIYELRRGLPMPNGEPLIETQARRGVRFVATVTRVERRESDASLDEVLATHRAWIDGRAALETLSVDAIARARAAFNAVARRLPGQATAHVGLANACALQFETTRTDGCPDVAALQLALQHAREACRLDVKSGEAWATLGFVLERLGQRDDALAAARQSIVLEPDNWRHHLRLSAASWGEERLREARRTLHLLPGLPMAHWLRASVLVARGLLAEAEVELRIGVTPIDHDAPSSPFGRVALNWLLGLLRFAQGATAEAMDAFHRELDDEHSGHLYSNEVAANTWYAIGATRLHLGDGEGARAAFGEVLDRVPAHPLARAALGMDVSGAPGLSAVDAAIARAVMRAARGDPAGCDAEAASIGGALAAAPPGNAGWLLPAEPMLEIAERPDAWARVLARLRSRAA